MKRIMGSSALTFEELSTVLIQIEALLNWRSCPFAGQPFRGGGMLDTLYIYSCKLYLSLACVIYLHIHAHEARARALPNALPRSVLFQSSLTVTCLRLNSSYSCSNIPSYSQSHFCYQRNQSASRLILLNYVECSVKTNKNQLKQLHFWRLIC